MCAADTHQLELNHLAEHVQVQLQMAQTYYDGGTPAMLHLQAQLVPLLCIMHMCILKHAALLACVWIARCPPHAYMQNNSVSLLH
jgi:hypothetical protein